MIRVALVGIGNCAAALVQGVTYYRRQPDSPGQITPIVCGLKTSDIEFVAAFDVDSNKVGRLLRDAIFSGRNNTLKFASEIESADCVVSSAPLLDGFGPSLAAKVTVVSSSSETVDCILQRAKPDVLVNYLPVGADLATRYWAEACLRNRIAFVNAIPSFIASNPDFEGRFREAGIPVAGDDVKSQIGATLLHRSLVRMFAMRGGVIDNTFQLNFGGNTDFQNMLEDGRLTNKLKSKVGSVASEFDSVNVDMHISPSGYIPHLKDQKLAYVNVSGTVFGGAPVEIECRIKVWDSPNSAGVIADVIRFAYAARLRGEGGAIPVCDFYFKSPPRQARDEDAWATVTSVAEQKLP